MTTKALQVTLGGVSDYATGWYYDPNTKQQYYYDSGVRKWYIYSAGVLQPLSVPEQSAPKVVSIKAGDRLKISMSYYYSGPAITGAEQYFSIGSDDFLGYHPEVEGVVPVNFRSCSTPTLFTAEKILIIPVGVNSRWTAIECKVWRGTPDAPETGIRLIGALEIVGTEAEITGFTIVGYEKV